ncbi:hypothetical protein Syun_014748 [Stephania yunnanensis]|uniref:Uncharacterized protein n=1 Tax=Stephania yunnanensis TaxID=152371 RepID=A0AAP0JJX4_9MAGN
MGAAGVVRSAKMSFWHGVRKGFINQEPEVPTTSVSSPSVPSIILAELKLKAEENSIDVQRRQKVKEAMLHSWTSYEKYAWGQDELRVGLELTPNQLQEEGKIKVNGFEIPLDNGGELLERFIKATENFTKPLNSLSTSDFLLASP